MKYLQKKPVQTNVAILTLPIQNHSGHLVGIVPILLKHFKDLVSYIGAERQTAKMKNKKQKLDSGYLYKALLDSTFTMPKSTLETSRSQTGNVSASESLLCN